MSAPLDLLLATAQRGQLHHALILHGPVAREVALAGVRIAKALNCLRGTTGDDCLACGKIDRDLHPDVHRIGVEGDRKMISIEQIRSVVAAAGLRPFEGRTKVFLIEDAETMSLSGANALLKTLEEPARDTVFLLLTRSPDLLLPTIRSRCQIVTIRPSVPVPANELAREEGISLQEARIRAAAETEQDARDALDRVRDWTRSFRDYAERRDTGALLATAAGVGSASDPRLAAATLAMLLRDLAALPPEASIDPQSFEAIQRSISPERLLSAGEQVLDGVTRLVVNVDPRLMIERALLVLLR